ALIDKAQSLGYRELILNAQTHAMPFYSRAGFTAEGEEFEEAGIPHRTMRRVLTR
ncbi:MAG: GNAT family N-acetyltransferase, partial [Pseudomonadota bacterium]|nr:GNAT family N-acetyltransferase [Pseudomonadota bacterium]